MPCGFKQPPRDEIGGGDPTAYEGVGTVFMAVLGHNSRDVLGRQKITKFDKIFSINMGAYAGKKCGRVLTISLICGTIPRLREIFMFYSNFSKSTDKYYLNPNDYIDVAEPAASIFETPVVHRLYRVVYLKSIAFNADCYPISPGTEGGYIESESNLSQAGNCVVLDGARVFGSANVSGDACVCDEATIYGRAVIKNNALVCGGACVCDDARVIMNGIVDGNACVAGNAVVCDCAHVFDGATIGGSAFVSGQAMVLGSAVIKDSAIVTDNAIVSGQATISGSAVIKDSAGVFDNANVSGFAKLEKRARAYDDCCITDAARVSNRAMIIGGATVGGKACIFDNAVVGGRASVLGNSYVGTNVEVKGNARLDDKQQKFYQNVIINGAEIEYQSGNAEYNAENVDASQDDATSQPNA